MKNLFEHTSAPWIRYSGYEYKTNSDDNLYITVSKNAKPEKPLSQAGRGMNFAARSVRISLMSINQEKRR